MKKILIIDDDISVTQMLAAEFGALGHETVCCTSAQDAFDHIKNTVFDLIILSVELPDQNGFVLCSKFRKDEETADIPLFLLSNATSAAAFEQHRNLPTHADGYFLKPLDMEVLIDTMNGVFSVMDDYKAQLAAHAEAMAEAGISNYDQSAEVPDAAEVPAKADHEEMIDVGSDAEVKPADDDSEVLKAINIDNIDLFGDIDANDVDDEVGELFDADAPFVIEDTVEPEKKPVVEKKPEPRVAPTESAAPASAVPRKEPSGMSKAVEPIAPIPPMPSIPRKESGSMKAVAPVPPASAVTSHPAIPPVSGLPRPNSVPPIGGIARPVPPVPSTLPPVSPIGRVGGVPSPATNAEITRLNAEIESLKAELASLKDAEGAMRNELEAAKASADSANIELVAVKSEFSRVQAELNSSKAELDQKDAFIIELQNTAATLVSPEQYNELVNQYNEFQTHYNELVDQFNELSVRCTTAETQLAEISDQKGNELEQLQTLLAQRDAHNALLKEVIVKLSELVEE